MENDTRKRTNGWVPKWATCKMCGEQYWRDEARRQYCDACRVVREEERKEEQRIRSAKWYRENKAKALEKLQERRRKKREENLPKVRLPEVKEPESGFKPHVCMVSKRCIYGSVFSPGCNYMTVTGELRTSGGEHQIIRGRCDLYRPRKGKAKAGWLADKDRKLERK